MNPAKLQQILNVKLEGALSPPDLLDLVDDIMEISGHPTRDQIDRIVQSYRVIERRTGGVPIAGGIHQSSIDQLVDELASLLEGKRVWCEHIYWDLEGYDGWAIIFDRSRLPDRVRDKYKVCPICAKPRPTES